MRLDRAALTACDRFVLPAGVIYFDGHALGVLPKATAAAVGEVVEREWELDELAEKLVDLDWFRQWRFSHVATVERLIGLETGTGGTARVGYVRRVLDHVPFPERGQVRTEP